MNNELMRLEDVALLAENVAKSGLFSEVNTKEKAFALMMLCQSEGLHPMQALRRYHLINGKPSLKADAMLGDFLKAGGRVTWTTLDENVCEATFEAPSIGAPFTLKWTMQDAQRAGITNNPTWKKYPRAMLRARVISEAIRMAMPQILGGLYTPEEVESFEDRPRTVVKVQSEPAPLQIVEAPAVEVDQTPKITPEDAEAIRTLLTGELGWAKPRAVNFLKKHFGVAAVVELTEAQAKTVREIALAQMTGGDEAYEAAVVTAAERGLCR